MVVVVDRALDHQPRGHKSDPLLSHVSRLDEASQYGLCVGWRFIQNSIPHEGEMGTE